LRISKLTFTIIRLITFSKEENCYANLVEIIGSCFDPGSSCQISLGMGEMETYSQSKNSELGSMQQKPIAEA
jgi:hypothetical protein